MRYISICLIILVHIHISNLHDLRIDHLHTDCQQNRTRIGNTFIMLNLARAIFLSLFILYTLILQCIQNNMLYSNMLYSLTKRNTVITLYECSTINQFCLLFHKLKKIGSLYVSWLMDSRNSLCSNGGLDSMHSQIFLSDRIYKIATNIV